MGAPCVHAPHERGGGVRRVRPAPTGGPHTYRRPWSTPPPPLRFFFSGDGARLIELWVRAAPAWCFWRRAFPGDDRPAH